MMTSSFCNFAVATKSDAGRSNSSHEMVCDDAGKGEW